MNAIEPVAEIMTGAAVARAVEPQAGVDASGHTTERQCLNCGTQLVGSFCHGCGQKGHVHRTLAAFGHDLLHGVLHLEGKIWRTLPLLMVKPGELTRRYIAGERARFVSPLALFLFSVFAMFAVMSLLGSPLDRIQRATQGQASAEVSRERSEIEAQLVALRRDRTAAAAKGEPTAAIDGEIREREIALDILAGLGAGRADERASADDINTLKVRVGDPGSRLDRAYRTAKQNPGLLIYKLQTNAYKFSWALIVLSVPFVTLLFLWRWRPVYDHTVFVTYSITAVSMLVIVASLLVLLGVPWNVLLVGGLLFVPWHMYRQLRGGYALRRLSALWRTVLLFHFAGIALGIFAFWLLMIGIM